MARVPAEVAFPTGHVSLDSPIHLILIVVFAGWGKEALQTVYYLFLRHDTFDIVSGTHDDYGLSQLVILGLGEVAAIV